MNIYSNDVYDLLSTMQLTPITNLDVSLHVASGTLAILSCTLKELQRAVSGIRLPYSLPRSISPWPLENQNGFKVFSSPQIHQLKSNINHKLFPPPIPVFFVVRVRNDNL